MSRIKRSSELIRRFHNFSGFKSISGIHPTYSININGVLKCKTGKVKEPIKTDEFGKWYKLLDVEGQVVTVNLAVLVSMVARNVSWSVDVCSKLTMYFMDGDCTNVHPSNTIWRPFPKNVEWKPGIRYIPGFSKYAISENGELFNVNTDRKLTWIINQLGYLVSSLLIDLCMGRLKQTTVSQHRMLVLGWTEYPINVCNLVVRHLDNNPSNNLLTNLCLGTQKENVEDAIRSGNWPGHVVEIRDVSTGNVSIHRSIKTASKESGIPVNTVKLRCKSNGTKVFDGKQWRFGLEEPWVENPNYSKHGSTYMVKYRDEPPLSFNSQHRAAKAICCRSTTLMKHLKINNKFIKGDYVVWREFRISR